MKRDLLGCRAELVRSIVHFNYFPASYLHPTRRADFLPGLPEKIWEIPRAWGSLSAVILRDKNITSPFLEPKHWGWPIALLPIDRLSRLARHVGAIALCDQIRSSLAREHVLSWKQRLGSDAYVFAMTSATLLPLTGFAEMNFSDRTPDQIGYQVISAAIESMPEPMESLCQLKLPQVSDRVDLDPAKARRVIASILEISEGKWSSSIAATQ